MNHRLKLIILLLFGHRRYRY